MIKKNGINNYKSLLSKMSKLNQISIKEVLDKLNKNVVCVGSGSSYTTAYLSSKLLKKYFNKTVELMTPRELLNDSINSDASIIIYSYSGTSKDTVYLRKIYPQAIVITGRNLEEFSEKKNIFSYYLSLDYEKGLILYENVIVPILLLVKEIDELSDIIEYEIANFNSYKPEIKDIKNIAIFDGDYTTAAALDLVDKLLETAVVKYDLYDKKNFSHGQYNYYKSINYDLAIYFKQKNVSLYEEILMNKLGDLLIVESEFNGYKASIDLIFKSFIIYNELLDKSNLNLFDDEYRELYKFEGDFK